MIRWDLTEEKYSIKEGCRVRGTRIIVECVICHNIKDIVYSSYRQTIKKNNDIYTCFNCRVSSEQFKNNCSEAVKKLWENNEYRNNNLNVVRSDEYRQKKSEESKLRWENNRDKLMQFVRRGKNDKIKERWQDPIYRKKICKALSENAKKRWEDDEYREKIISSLRKNLVKANAALAEKRGDTRPELIVQKILDDLCIRYVKQYQFGFYLVDFYIENYNMIIEVQGDYWHTIDKGVNNDIRKATYISKHFPGVSIKYVWEHELGSIDRVINLFKNWFGINNELINFNFNDIGTKEIEFRESDLFLGAYHYMGRLRRGGIKIGAFLDDILIAVCVFSTAVRKEIYERLNIKSNELLELSRFCIHPSYQKKNFGSWFISKCTKFIGENYGKVLILISFADTTFNHDGTIYKAAGWEYDGEVNPSYWYVDKDGYVKHKKTLYDNAQSLRMIESEFAVKFGYRKVHGFKKLRFIKRLK